MSYGGVVSAYAMEEWGLGILSAYPAYWRGGHEREKQKCCTQQHRHSHPKPSFQDTLILRAMQHLLLMPVINLVNISKHDFILSSHVLRDTLFFYSLHETLQGGGNGE